MENEDYNSLNIYRLYMYIAQLKQTTNNTLANKLLGRQLNSNLLNNFEQYYQILSVSYIQYHNLQYTLIII